jgi:hypothetical protein
LLQKSKRENKLASEAHPALRDRGEGAEEEIEVSKLEVTICDFKLSSKNL